MSAFEDILPILTLQDYNTRVVVLGTALLGLAAGVVGTFTLLRKRALMGDALAHATLPGIASAFLIATLLGANGKSLPVLLLGATVSGVLGVAAVMLIRSVSRLKEDAAMGIVLSVFFGLGTAIVQAVQQLPQASAAGLESFIYGKTASMLASDAMLIGGAAVAVVLLTAVMFKELTLLCFDAASAAAQGRPVWLLDAVLMTMVIVVTVIGLQAVGLILILALLITPAAAARFWTDRLPVMVGASAAIGAASGWGGASLSALAPSLPAGAIIVLVVTALFALSLLFGPARGVVVRWLRHRSARRDVARPSVPLAS